jgi:hypothetical protein
MTTLDSATSLSHFGSGPVCRSVTSLRFEVQRGLPGFEIGRHRDVIVHDQPAAMDLLKQLVARTHIANFSPPFSVPLIRSRAW